MVGKKVDENLQKGGQQKDKYFVASLRCASESLGEIVFDFYLETPALTIYKNLFRKEFLSHEKIELFLNADISIGNKMIRDVLGCYQWVPIDDLKFSKIPEKSTVVFSGEFSSFVFRDVTKVDEMLYFADKRKVPVIHFPLVSELETESTDEMVLCLSPDDDNFVMKSVFDAIDEYVDKVVDLLKAFYRKSKYFVVSLRVVFDSKNNLEFNVVPFFGEIKKEINDEESLKKQKSYFLKQVADKLNYPSGFKYPVWLHMINFAYFEKVYADIIRLLLKRNPYVVMQSAVNLVEIGDVTEKIYFMTFKKESFFDFAEEFLRYKSIEIDFIVSDIKLQEKFLSGIKEIFL